MRRLVSVASRVVPGPPVGILRMTLGEVPCELVLPRRPRVGRAILHLHGGGYVQGSAREARPLTTRLAHLTRVPVFAVDYSLAPEHAFPSALGDAVSSYDALLDTGRCGKQIVVAGEGAGGGLALAAAHALRDLGRDRPAALALFSPWLDLTLSGDGVAAGSDSVLTRSALADCAQRYGAGTATDHPGCSPLFGSHHDLPPILAQVGRGEILRGDASRLAALAPDVEVQVYEQGWHGFQHHAGVLPAAAEALNAAAAFLETSWSAAGS